MTKFLTHKFKHYIQFLFFFLIALSIPAAADELALEEAVISALASNERIAAARSNLRAAEEDRIGARSAYHPQINAVGTYGYNDIDQFNSSGSLQRDGKKMYGGIEVKQDLFTWGRNKANVTKSEAHINIAQHELTATQHEITLETISAFLGTQAANETVEAYNKHVATLQQLLKGSQSKFNLSLISSTELALVTSRHQQALAQLSMAQAELAKQRDDLSRLTHLNFTSLGNHDTMHLGLPITVEDAIGAAFSNSPHYLKAAQEMAVAKATLDATSAERYPALSATGRWVKGRVGDLPTGDKEVGLSMSMPLYDGGMTSSKIRRAKHDLNRARHNKESMGRRTEQDARSAFITLNSSRFVSKSWTAALSAEEKSLRGIEKEIEASLEGLPYLLEAKDKMMMVRIQAIQTKVRAQLAEFELLLSTGEILKHFLSRDIRQE